MLCLACLYKKRKRDLRAWLDMEEEVEVRAACEFGKLEIGFDFGSDGLVRAPQRYDYDCTLYARLGLYCYNFEKGTNLKFVRWEKYNFIYTSYYDVYLTLHAMDPACSSVFPFQTLFSDAGSIAKDTYVINMWRIRPTC
ncbi:PREDICTED: UPF0725 protein At5g63820-like [Camelina sativa]|uniref:UPF0725 protein At5g63820-like n=1 Tax=Camelina sativa TaxID=90675 RepID=A0ABM1QJT6_CAMSA|nr:PREDICTED: UPF0725 protein At5g63820-like [Camelina sativa]